MNSWKKYISPTFALVMAVGLLLLSPMAATADINYDSSKFSSFGGSPTVQSDGNFKLTGIDANSSQNIAVDEFGIYLKGADNNPSMANAGTINISTFADGMIFRITSLTVNVQSSAFTFDVKIGNSTASAAVFNVDPGNSSTYDSADGSWYYKTIPLSVPAAGVVHVSISGQYIGQNTSIVGFSVEDLPQALPAVSTQPVTSHTSTTAVIGGNVSSEGDASVTERGVVYSAVDSTPQIGDADVVKEAIGTGAGDFSNTISGLTAGTTYYVCAYATSDLGTAYGTVVSFTATDLTVSETGILTFDSLEEGYNAAGTDAIKKAITLTKQGGGAITNLAAAMSGGASTKFLIDTVLPDALGEGILSASFDIRPHMGLAPGTYAETVTVTADGGISRSFDVSFTVTAAPTYGISLTPAEDYAFPSETIGYSVSPTYDVTVSNTGTGATGNLAVALSGTDAASFQLSTPSILSLAASGSESFTVSPLPSLPVGTYTATVTVSGGGSVGSQSFDVSFTVEHSYSISLDQHKDYDFPPATVGYGPQTPLTVMVTNTGTGATGALTVSLNEESVDYFDLSTTSLASLAPESSTTFTVVPKTGLAQGGYDAAVTVSGDAVGSERFDILFIVFPIYGISLDPADTYVFPAAIVDYGEQTAKNITISNAGTWETGDLTVALSGDNADSFTLSETFVPSIAVSSSAGFTVKPNTGLAIGTYIATVTVAGDSVDAQTLDISFTVELEPTHIIGLNPAADHAFPAATVGYGPQAAYQVTVNSTGTGDSGALSIALSGENADAFALNKTTIPAIAPSGSDNFTVAPKTGLAQGDYTATVTVSGGGVISRSFGVSFTVNHAYGIALNPAVDYTFPGATEGYGAQTAYQVTVNNTGTDLTGALNVALSGADADAFALNKTFMPAIAPSGSGSFTVTPKTGLAADTYTATVTVSGGSVTSCSFGVSFTVNSSYGIALNPAVDYTFPEATEGYGAQTAYEVTVSNTGTGVTGALGIALSGADADAFALNKTSMSAIAPSGSDSFTVAPKTGLAADTYTATVTVSGAKVEQRSILITFKVNYEMSESTLEKVVSPTTTVIVEGLLAKSARLIVTPLDSEDDDREALEERASAKNAIAAYEVHVEPAEAFRPPLTLTFKVGEKYNGHTVYILHKLGNGDIDIFQPTVVNGEAVITVHELSPFLLAIDPAVIIAQQPQSVTALIGTTATFSVTAEGLEPFAYQWQRRTSATGAWKDIAGATGPGYTTTTLNKSHNGYAYRVIVTDVLNNSATSNVAVLTVVRSPETGDASHPLAYGALAVVFAAVAVLMLRKRKPA